MIFEFGKGVREAQRAHLMKSYTNWGNDIEKGGEGSRGGKIIGHTKSGKPIYESVGGSVKKFNKDHSHFSSEDHRESADLHKKLRDEHRGKYQKTKSNEDYDKFMAHEHEYLKHDSESDKKVGIKHKYPSSSSQKAVSSQEKRKNDVEKSESMKVDKQELIDEHKKLVNVLESPSHEDDKKEAKKQKKELKEYEDDVKKSEETELQKAYKTLGINL